MGYYMRYIATEDPEISLSDLEQTLKQIDPAYSIDESGELTHDGDLYGVAEIYRVGDDSFADEIEELKEFVEDAAGPRQADVLKVLDEAKATIGVQVLWQGREVEETLQKIDPLWEWLLANRKGLLQADGEGFYDESGLILEVE